MAAPRGNDGARRRRRRPGDGPAEEPDFPALSARETEVLMLASYGRTNHEIANDLTLAPSTIKSHLKNIYVKLEAGNRASAVAAALRYGLID